MEHQTKSQNSGRGKGRGRGRGRKKQAIVDTETKVQELVVPDEDRPPEPEVITLDLDADITQLEAPTFSTINKGPPEPMLRLNWDHKTHLIGEKVINPMIHCCDKCDAPILIYGRMIPCKHVFCFTCAESDSKACPRCNEKVVRIEKTGVGTVFMCTFGGTRYGNTGCRRTYLSQRDLQAHINHRHVSGTVTNKESLINSQVTSTLNPAVTVPSRTKSTIPYHMAAAGDPRVHTTGSSEYFHKMHHSPSSHTSSSSQQSLRQSHHHSHLLHHSEQSSASNIQHQHSGSLQSSPMQRHLQVSSAQQLLQPADFVNQMMGSYSQPASTSVTSSSTIRSNNLITVQIQDSKIDPGGSTLGLSSRSTNFHQSYSPQFSQTSSPGITFSVPPPGQPAMSPIAQSQYFSPTPLTAYPTSSPQRATVPQFSPNSPAQPIMSQPQLVPASSSTPRRSQFPPDPVMPPFPVPPPAHRWHQPPSSQTHFY